MRNLRCLLLFAILFASCSKKEKKADVLSQKKMREVMWDMIRADQYVGDLVTKDSTKNKKDESIKLYEEVFHIHKTTRQTFKKSLDYYASRPDLFRPIIDSLVKRKNDFIPPTTRALPDSLIKERMRKRERKQ